ncbi:MAG: S8 family serine peptidase, partial [Myxococcota bacterium]
LGSGARWGPLGPAARVDPSLWASGDAIVVAELVPGADPRRVVQALTARGLSVDGVGRRVVARVPDARREEWLTVASAMPEVAWISRRGRRVLLDAAAAVVSQSGLGGSTTPFTDLGLDGTGQIAALIDTGIDVDHCAFVDAVAPATDGVSVAASRKVIAVDFLFSGDDPSDPGAWDDQGHGSLVAGIIAGDDGADGVIGQLDGLAPGAKLVVQDAGFAVDDCADLPALGCPVVDLVPLFEQAYAQGARVHNDSWGDQENAAQTNVYTDGSADADQVSWDHPDYLLVFASGNEGLPYTVFSPSNAKNTLSVGATDYGPAADELAYFTSGGPTSDGRIKPDLVMPGIAEGPATDFDVTTGACGGTAAGGTSLASPAAAGLALIVRQYFEDGWYPSAAANPSDGWSPTSALVKAALLASTQPVNGGFESTGFGRPQLDTVLPLDPGGARALIAVDEGAGFVGGEAPHTTSFTVNTPGEPLVVVLTWRDPPGNPLAVTQLVNDLDLVVRGPGDDWVGNHLDGFWSAPDGEPDRLNNVEVVRIESPAVGAWTVEVTPHQVAVGPQPFALVVSGGFGAPPDTGAPLDTAVPEDSGATVDTVDTVDTDTPPSTTGESADTGAKPTDDGCGCAGGPTGSVGGAVLSLALIAAGRRRLPEGRGVVRR